MASPDKSNPGSGFRIMLPLLVFLLGLFFYRLGSYPLFDLDEPRYAEAAREMLELGNWITPYFNYELRFDKPVFFYWLIAIAYKLFGVSEFAARFFSAVTATLTVLMVYAFARHWVSERYGLFSALILATSILFAGLARMSITDMTLSFFMTGTTLSLFMAAHRDLRWWLAAGTFSGLAVLTKGPVGIVVPGAIFCLYTLATGQFKRCLLNRWLPLALLTCLLVAVPWYIAAYMHNGPIFLEALFLHNVTRFSDIVSGHQQPVYFYAIVLMVGFMPWTAYLPAAIRRFQEQSRTGHRTAILRNQFSYLINLYAVIWTAFIFIFFTVSHTKLLTYILPLFPALALWMAEAWHAESAEVNQPNRRWFMSAAGLLVAAAVIAGTVFITNMDRLLPREAQGVSANAFNGIAVAVLIIGLLAVAGFIRAREMAVALMTQAATVLLLGIVALHGIVPNVSRATQGTMLHYLKQANESPLILYEIQRPSLTFYGRRRIPRYVNTDREKLVRELNRNQRTLVITREQHLQDFYKHIPATMQVKILEKDPPYRLLSVSNAP